MIYIVFLIYLSMSFGNMTCTVCQIS